MAAGGAVQVRGVSPVGGVVWRSRLPLIRAAGGRGAPVTWLSRNRASAGAVLSGRVLLRRPGTGAGVTIGLFSPRWGSVEPGEASCASSFLQRGEGGRMQGGKQRQARLRLARQRPRADRAAVTARPKPTVRRPRATAGSPCLVRSRNTAGVTIGRLQFTGPCYEFRAFLSFVECIGVSR